MISLPDESLDLPGDPSGDAGWHKEGKSFAPCSMTRCREITDLCRKPFLNGSDIK
jgi:hypothetical protein